MENLKKHIIKELENLLKIKNIVKNQNQELSKKKITNNINNYNQELSILTKKQEKLEESRNNIIASIKKNIETKKEDLNLSQIINIYIKEESKRETFKKLQKKLKMLLKEIKEINQINKAIIKDNLTIINKTIDIYTKKHSLESDYKNPNKKDQRKAVVFDALI